MEFAADLRDKGFIRSERPWEREQRQREERKLEEAVAAHRVHPPRGAVETAVVRNGERQWLAKTSGDLTVLDMLMVTDVHSINMGLRSGDSIKNRVGPMLDWNGFESGDKFVERADTFLDSLGTDIELDTPIVAYRGIGLWYKKWAGGPDIWNLLDVCSAGRFRDVELSDPAFVFASPWRSLAQEYRGYNPGGPPPDWTIDFELLLKRAYCLPGGGVRSTEMMRAMYPYTFLRDTVSQMIVPRNSLWRIRSVRPGPRTNHRTIRLEQIA
jgi:hypothetical protein